MNRIEVRASVMSCTRCPLHTVGSGPIPFRGPAPTKIAIIGEAPGRVEDASRKPFVGPSGLLAANWLERVGIRPDNVAWLNVVSCYPGRTPTPKEVVECRDNLMAQLSVVLPEFLILFGGIALSSWWPGLRIGDMRGLWFQAPISGTDLEPWAMATWHPAAVLRNRTKEVQVLADLEKFRGGRPEVSWACILCKSERVYTWEPGGSFGWCVKHDPTSKLGKGRSTKSSRPPRTKDAPKKSSKPPATSSLFPTTTS